MQIINTGDGEYATLYCMLLIIFIIVGGGKVVAILLLAFILFSVRFRYLNLGAMVCVLLFVYFFAFSAAPPQ